MRRRHFVVRSYIPKSFVRLFAVCRFTAGREWRSGEPPARPQMLLRRWPTGRNTGVKLEDTHHSRFAIPMQA
jgi:hypothetical protein